VSIPSTCTSEELRLLTGYSKAALIALEQQAVIKRVATNAWPLPDTLVALMKHLRERKSPVSDGRARWEWARAKREEMKAQQEAGKLTPASDFQFFADQVGYTTLKWLDAIPARLAGQDLPLRRRAQEVVNWARSGLSGDMARLGKGTYPGVTI
jgi:phage terminase Nu1 subunit (DNA packaging protein)